MKRLTPKCSLVVQLVFSMFLLYVYDVSDCIAQVNIEPNMEPGKVYNLDEIPKGWFDSYFPNRSIWGENVLLSWLSFAPEASYGAATGDLQAEECMIYVLKGPITLNPGDDEIVLHETDCTFLGKGDKCILTSGPDSAELLMIQWPVIPLFISMKMWQDKTEPLPAIPPLSKPLESQEEITRLREIGMLDIAKNVRGRFVQGKRGQICDLVLTSDAVFGPVKAAEEEFLYVLQGTLEKNINGKTVSMREGDVMYIPSGMVHGTKAGPYGCRVMVLITPARTEYADAFEKQGKKLDRLVSPGVKPEVYIDGSKTEPNFIGAEGASWMNGKLYFSSQQSGVHAVDSDSSLKLITKDIGTCGTAPLPNGNLAVCDLTNKRIIEISTEGEIVKILADSKGGLPNGNPNDLTTDAKGGVYVTVNDWTGKGEKTDVVVYINPKGKLIRLTDYREINFPNGIVLSPDGSKLFVGSDETIVYMFDVQADGTISNKLPFAYINLGLQQIGKEDAKSMADGMIIDSAGNLYITSQAGVQVFDNSGGYLGTIQMPASASNIDFGGENLKTLFLTARDKVYSLKMNVAGVQYPIR